MSWEALFDGWSNVLRVVVVGVIAYAALVGLLRVSGKRTLAKMNAFDFVVTVALGSTLATILLSKDVSLVDGVAALATLIGMQFVVAWLSVRSAVVRRLARSEPRLLLRRGAFVEGAMIDERISKDEVLAAIRSEGVGRVNDVDAVILETDGSFSVIASISDSNDAALHPVRGYERS